MPPLWALNRAGAQELPPAVTGAVAVCPHLPLSTVTDLGSPNRGHYSTKQISLLSTLGNTPRGHRDPSATSSLFISKRGEGIWLVTSPSPASKGMGSAGLGSETVWHLVIIVRVEGMYVRASLSQARLK